MRSGFGRGLLAAAAIGLAPGGGAEELPVSDGGWEVAGPGARIERVDGREALAFETGAAYRRDVRLEDGTIELELQTTRRRSFVYLMFRMQDDGEFEEIYLRPHKSCLPDAVQYAPVYQGRSAWQLHHGPGATAAPCFEPGVWTRVRLVLKGRRAALFLGDGDEPALVAHLAREPRAGYLAVRGFLPGDVPGSGPIARYAGIRIRPGEVPFQLASPSDTPADPAPGVVRAWSVSEPVAPPEGIAATLPESVALGSPRRVEADASGLVELHRHVRLPAGRGPAAAVASLTLRAESAGLRAFDLGFSDRASVFLNGRPLFAGDASYSFDEPRREGLIGFDQARLWLPLEAGDNRLAVLVSDGFGGWGLMGRFPDGAEGIEIR